MDDIEETVVGKAKIKRRKKRANTPVNNRFRKNEKQQQNNNNSNNKFGINQVANLGPQSESTYVDPVIVPIIEQLTTRGYDSRPEFNKVLNVIKRRHKFQGRNSDLLRVYKLKFKTIVFKSKVNINI